MGQSGALDVFDSTQILGHTITVLLANGRHLLTGELLADTRVVAQIGLGTDDQAGNTGAVVVDFGEPFLANVLKGRGGGDGEADQEDIGLGVRQRAKTIVILLSGGIKQTQGVGLITDPEVSRKKLESVQVFFCSFISSDAWFQAARPPKAETRCRSDLHDSNRIVVEDRRNIFRGEFVCCVRDEQTCLSHSTVSNHDTPGQRELG